MAFEIENGVLKRYIEEEGVTEVVIPDGVTKIEHDAFSCCETLKHITIPDSVITIGSGAFAYCASLTDIHIPNSVKSLGSAAFFNCANLKHVILSDNIWRIDSYTFSMCYKLASIHLPRKLKRIGTRAFGSCYSLTSIELPDGLKQIGSEAFRQCDHLPIMDLYESITKIGTDAFPAGRSIRYHEKGFSCIIKLEHDWIDLTDMPWWIPKLDENSPSHHAEIRAIQSIVSLHNFIICKNNIVRSHIFDNEWSESYKTPLAFLMLNRDDVYRVYLFYLRSNFHEVMEYIFEHDAVDELTEILRRHIFLNYFEKDPNKYLEAAIQHTQNGGSPEIQMLLTQYMHQYFGFLNPTDQFNL